MSDESAPPSLRLKPRLRTEKEAPAGQVSAGVAPVPADPLAPPAENGGRSPLPPPASSTPIAPPAPTVPAPTLPAPTVPGPTVPAPSLPAPSSATSGNTSETAPAESPARLRLRPKLSPAEGAGTGATPSGGTTTPAPVETAGPAKAAAPTMPAPPAIPTKAPLPSIPLFLPPETAPTAAAPATPAPVTAPKVDLPPTEAAPPAAGATALPAGIPFPPEALQMAPGAAGAAEVATTPPSDAPPPRATPPPPPSGLPPAAVGVPKAKPPAPHLVPHIRGPEGEVPEPETDAAKTAVPPVQRRGFKIGLSIAAILLVVLLGTGGFVAWQITREETPPPKKKEAKSSPVALPKPMADAIKPEAAPKTTPPAPSATKTDLGDELAHAPKKAIDKAQDAIAARRQLEQERINALATGQEPPEKRSPGSAAAAKTRTEAVTTTAAPASPTVAPGTPPPPAPTRIVAPTVETKTTIPASPAFKQFVAELVIRGVMQGNPPRALIGGRTFQAGDLVDKGLGVIFVGIDAEKKTITFKDGTGAIITRKYM